MKRAGWFGEQVVRERLNANTTGLAIDAGQHAPLDLLWLPRSGVDVGFEVKAQLDQERPARPTPDEAAMRGELLDRGRGWVLARVVYRKNGAHSGKGKPRFVVVSVDLVDVLGVDSTVWRYLERAICSQGRSAV